MSEHSPGKFEYKIPVAQLPAFLREMAEHLEKKELNIGNNSIHLDKLEGFKINWKYKSSKSEVKVKVKCDEKRPEIGDVSFSISHEVTEESVSKDSQPEPRKSQLSSKPGQLPKYKKLKKSMDQQFSQIRKQLNSGSLPGKEEVKNFVDECHTMTLYAGKGDEYYGVFMEAVKGFNDAINQQSVEEAKTAADRLKQVEKECHDRYR